jgi:hypothetical protein
MLLDVEDGMRGRDKEFEAYDRQFRIAVLRQYCASSYRISGSGTKFFYPISPLNLV